MATTEGHSSEAFRSYGSAAAEPRGDLPQELGIAFPREYLRFMERYNGGEGFVGDSFVILFRLEDLPRLNSEYEFERHVPGLVLCGSNGGGEALAFDTRDQDTVVVEVPFVGPCFEHVEIIQDGLAGLLGADLLSDTDADVGIEALPADQRAMEICEITPVILSGDPIDPENKVALPRAKHIEFVRYWNSVIARLRAGEDVDLTQ